ncbi:hypothetical protein PC111_g5334 [Phytophthora cactorum]|nr:hypothetical protein PC111_g5334 [Phytophthora cactorum]
MLPSIVSWETVSCTQEAWKIGLFLFQYRHRAVLFPGQGVERHASLQRPCLHCVPQYRGILAEQIELDSIPVGNRENLQKGVCAPDGLCISNFGPVEGRLHDSTMLRESKLPPYLASHPMVQRLGMVIYGGPAYGVDELLCRPFHNAVERSSEKRFNEIMSKNRVSIK